MGVDLAVFGILAALAWHHLSSCTIVGQFSPGEASRSRAQISFIYMPLLVLPGFSSKQGMSFAEAGGFEHSWTFLSIFEHFEYAVLQNFSDSKGSQLPASHHCTCTLDWSWSLLGQVVDSFVDGWTCYSQQDLELDRWRVETKGSNTVSMGRGGSGSRLCQRWCVPATNMSFAQSLCCLSHCLHYAIILMYRGPRMQSARVDM